MIDGNKLFREIYALGLIFLFLLLTVSLATYSPLDPTLNQQVSPGSPIHNYAGLVGASISGFLVELLGLGSWIAALLALWGGLSLLWPALRLSWTRWLGLGLLILSFLGWSGSPWGEEASLGPITGGGLFGEALFYTSRLYLKDAGSILLWLFAIVAGLQLVFRFSWAQLSRVVSQSIAPALRRLPRAFSSRSGSPKPLQREAPPQKAKQEAAQKPSSSPSRQAKAKAKSKGKAQSSAEPRSEPSRTAGAAVKAEESALLSEYPLPDLLSPLPEKRTTLDQEQLQELSRRLTDCLLEFGVQGELEHVQPGPVVSMFEFKPAPGIKISRIANLSHDLALALKAYAVRIEAPIPGKDLVGIEVPNKERQTVYFREIVESKAFSGSKHPLPMALGQNIQGGSRVEDLSRMPHLLVAGATGAGKSVCLNSILLSLLFKSSPDEVKLLLIDPKRIELASYAELPHLVHPVVTEMELAKTALDWAVYEMERRYQAMARLSVRHIQGFNRRLEELKAKDPESVSDLEPLPYLVIVIDELADLMLTAGKEVESSIVRLAQLARAAGIHIILATQRPSVDVVTGLIKANFPARIAFQVTSKHDSRTILDSTGAEYLLGMGDMLFKPSAGRVERVHGAFVSDEEITSVIEFWKHKQPRQSEVDFKAWKNEAAANGAEDTGEDISRDPMYDQAVSFVLDQGKASISMIQRHLRIGFNRAARFVEQMERDGVVGPQEGSKPRQVIRNS